MKARVLGALGVSIATHGVFLGGLAYELGGGAPAAPAAEPAVRVAIEPEPPPPPPPDGTAAAGEAGAGVPKAPTVAPEQVAMAEPVAPQAAPPAAAWRGPSGAAEEPSPRAAKTGAPPRAAPPPPPPPARKRRRLPPRTEAPAAGASASRRRRAPPLAEGAAAKEKHAPTAPHEATPHEAAAREPAARAEAVAEAVAEAEKATTPAAKPEPDPAKPPAPPPPPPKPKPETEHSADAAKAPDADATSGDGVGGEARPAWYKFARSGDLGGAIPAPAGPGVPQYIGDRNVSADRTTRVATTTERSLGNARGHGEAMPVPDGHLDDPNARVALGVVKAPSLAPVSGNATTAGGAGEALGAAPEAGGGAAGPAPGEHPSGLRLSVAGEVSDEQVRAAHEADLALAVPAPRARVHPRRRASPAGPKPAPVDAVASTDPEPAAAPAPDAPLAASPARSAPPAGDDGFWGPDGLADGGAGTAATDSPEAREGEDVKRQVYKKDGAGWTEITTLADDVALGEVAAVSIRKTELGVWFTAVDDLVRASWKPPVAELALGAEGRVLVEFTILRNGRVRDVAMLDTNASLAMQEAALHAVPAGVPAPPRGEGPLRVRFEFRYGTGAHPR